MAERAELQGIPWYHVRFRGLGDPISHFQLFRIARSEGAAVIHGHSRRSAFYSGIAARIARRRSVATIHSMHTWKGFDLNDRMIAVSEAVRESLVKRHLPGERIDVIHNGTPTLPVTTPAERQRMRERWGIAPDQLAIAMVGRIVAHKGHNLLLESLQNLGSTFAHVHLFFLGAAEGDWALELRQRTRAAALDSRVHFLGYRGDVTEILAAMDLFVLPSLTEALSLALLEAMSVGLPVVAARIEGVPEAVQDGYNGLLFEPGSVESLTRTLGGLLENPAQRAELGARARDTQRQNFSDDVMIDKTCALYRCLTEERYASV